MFKPFINEDNIIPDGEIALLRQHSYSSRTEKPEIEMCSVFESIKVRRAQERGTVLD